MKNLKEEYILKNTISFSIIILLFSFLLTGCSLFGKKKFEQTETYKELIKMQEERDKLEDSLKKLNYQQLTDTLNQHDKELDSLKRITDSLKNKLDKNIQELKNKKY